MKLLKKCLIVLLLVVMMAGCFISPNTANDEVIVFASSSQQTILQAVNVPSELKLGQTMTISTGSINDANKYSAFKLFDAKGQVMLYSYDYHILNNDSSKTTEQLKNVNITYSPKRTGVYTLVYGYFNSFSNSEFVKTSKEFFINVTGSQPVFEFEENSELIIPNVISGTDEVVLPYPKVLNTNGDYVVNPVINIYVTDANANSITLTEKTINNIVYKKFSPVINNEEVLQGYYTITYEYQTSIQNNYIKKQFMVKVDSSFDSSNIELNYTFDNSSIPTSAVLGKEVVLPIPTVKDVNNNNEVVNAFVDVNVKFIPSSNASDSTVLNFEVDNYTFVPNKATTNGGRYEIVYSINDFYGNTIDTNKTIFVLDNVLDTEAPVAVPVKDYLVANVSSQNFDNTNVDYLIPSRAQTGYTLSVPAIFATDNFNQYSDLVLTRTISKNSGTATEIGKDTPNLAVNYTFDSAGTYKITYYATDKANNNNKSLVTYKVIVTDTYSDNQAPRIKMSTIPEYVKVGDIVEFDAPTIIDYSTSNESETNVDNSRVKKVISYQKDSNTPVVLELNDNNKYSFEVPNCTTLKVLVSAEDCFSNENNVVREINVLGINDNEAPLLIDDSNELLNYYTNLSLDQGNRVEMQKPIKFSDGLYTKYLSVSVCVYDSENNLVSVSSPITKRNKTGSDITSVELVNGSFLAAKSGEYRIVYTATDMNNNITNVVYFVNVGDSIPPVISFDHFPTNVEVGESINIPNPTIKDNGTEINNYSANPIQLINYTSRVAPYFNPETLEFIAFEQATYTFVAEGIDASNNKTTSRTFDIVATDSIDPILNIDQSFIFNKSFPLTDSMTVSIPNFDPSDATGIKSYSVVIKNPNQTVIKEYLNGEGITENSGLKYYTFNPTSNGVYEVIYKAIDNSNRVVTESFDIYIGDAIAPTIVIDNPNVNAPTTMKKNERLVLSVEDIYANDFKDGKITLSSLLENSTTKKFAITLTGPDGSQITNTSENGYAYSLSNVGSYKLKYSVEDNAGNKAEKTVTIEVTEKLTDPIITTESVGIILIVISCAILAAVIVYFISSRKKSNPTPIVEVKKED